MLLATSASTAAAAPNGNTPFAQSYAANNVTNVTATSQLVSCYSPEVTYFDTLAAGYPGGGMSPCPGATTGEQTQGFATQDVSNPAMLVKDHSESDIRVDPANPLHLIGQSKWFVSAEGYNHLLGFYESWDGGKTFPVQGHVPGYEGWTDNTDPVSAFDPWGNFYSLVLPYEFVYAKSGGHVFNNGSNQANPAQPPEAVSVAVHPAARAGRQTARNWITTHNGSPDFVFTTKNADTNTPDKQWIAIDGHPFDTYLLPHVAPDGTLYTTVTNNPVSKGFLNNSIYLLSSTDGGDRWSAPSLVIPSVLSPTYRNATFTEGIVNSFGLGSTKVGGHWPLYVAYENEDPDGYSRVPALTPIGRNIRLSKNTCDPQLNAPKRFCICGSSTFLGDYFGLDFGGGYTYTTSISTYEDGTNPENYQQQVVARVATP